jgi:Flp pilus assembly protein TadB
MTPAEDLEGETGGEETTSAGARDERTERAAPAQDTRAAKRFTAEPEERLDQIRYSAAERPPRRRWFLKLAAVVAVVFGVVIALGHGTHQLTSVAAVVTAVVALSIAAVVWFRMDP